MQETKCAYCQRPFRPSSTNMKFCRAKCRDAYKYRMRVLKKEQAKKEQELAKLRQQLAEQEQLLAQSLSDKKAKQQKAEQQEQKYAALRKTYKVFKQSTDEQLFNYLVEKRGLLYRKGLYEDEVFGSGKLRIVYTVADKQEDLKAYKQEVEQMMKGVPNPLFDLDFLLDDPKQELEQKIKQIKEQIETLEQTEIKLELPKPPPSNPETKQDKKDRKERMLAIQQNRPSKELGGGDIRKMNFKAFTYPGELGRFLGELDNNMVAIALTGDSGAGKSYFSYALAKLFLTNHKTVKYYSLEEGIGKVTQDKLDLYEIGNEIKITDSGTIEDIEEAAQLFDVIIIDSYSKVTKDPREFDWLRNNHPKTLFIVIFQKTTNKTIKGGASIMYDSSITIDVTHWDGERVAVILKGRYGTGGWVYSIDQGRIIEES